LIRIEGGRKTANEIFIAKPSHLIELLTGIHNHKIALPEFQRKWKWEPERVRDLLISVAYQYPAGSLLTMPVTNNKFALRPFDGAGDLLKDSPNLMVLDGQQRLTSLYQALFRQDGVRFNERRGSSLISMGSQVSLYTNSY
jgi:uncharacterized protein with ParB-like and HNH nuclease domain